MSLICTICTKAYTSNGTEHALFSTKCGHLFGKSCLEKLAREKNKGGKFNCPVCREYILNSDYHPIYDVPNEFFEIVLNDTEDKCKSEDDVMKRCALGTLKEKHFLIKQDIGEDSDYDECTIEHFDASNGYILVAGFVENYSEDDDVNTFSFLKIYEDKNVIYSKIFAPTIITAVAFNKSCEDCLEFCVGLENGVIQNTVIFFSSGVVGTPHETVLFNENEKIRSICFLRYNDIVYSVGDRRTSNLFNIQIDRVHLKKNWFEDVEVELKKVTSLKVLNDRTLFGIMGGKIYVFEENEIPYVVYSEDYVRFDGYEYDSVTNIMFIKAVQSTNGSLFYGTPKLLLIRIKKNYIYDTKGWRSEKYTSYSIGDFQDDSCNISLSLRSLPITTKRCGGNFTYTFVPDDKSGVLQAYFVNNDGLIELLCEEKIKHLIEEKNGDLWDCIGIIALNKPQFFTSKIIKIPIVIIFDRGFMVYNFYSSIDGVESRRF
uniref:RING-type domain-containing protein n=1 Tax=Strongyloides papillosus TaxID=174720 RepID=A0A0N5BFS8_STREA